MTTNKLKTAFRVLGLTVILLLVILGLKQYGKTKPQSLIALMGNLGSPSILAKKTEFENKELRLLRVLVPPFDPKSISNWTVMTNCIVIWIESETGQENAGFFYDEMKKDEAFDGGGWYSARNIFGEKITIAYVDSEGMVTNQESFKIDAISFKLDGFVFRKRNDHSLRGPTQKH